MSQTSSNKGKDISGKKFTSYNITQAYKSKVDNKTGSVQGVRHGMQSLGKIGQSRRVLQPASLPSLKKENSGNDPRVNLVPPTGSQGWVKKDGQNSVDGTPSGSIDPTKATVVKNPTNNQEISLRPHAGVVPGARPTAGGIVEEGQKPSWVSKVQPQPPQGATKYFQREFPTLGGDAEKDITAENHAEKTEQDASHLVMAHPQAFINSQKWMDGSNSAMMVPANFSQFKGDPAQMFSGQQQCYSFPMQMYPGDMHNYPLHHMYMPYATGPAGKIPLNLYPRIPNSVLNTNPQLDQTSVSKDSDKDDNGWAGAQEEVDYNAKLKFDESDESDDDAAKKPKEENSQKLDQSEEHKQEKIIKATPESWPESQSFPTHVHMQAAAYSHQNWSRMPFSFDPRAPVPYFLIPRYPFPVVMSAPSELSDRNIENKSKEAEHLKESPPIKPDDKRDADRKAAAQAKLRKVEEDIKKREAERKHNEADGKKTSFEMEDKVNVGLHKRSDSEASDSSRHTRDIPPRFQRQISAQKQPASTSINSEVNSNDIVVDSHLRTILKRKESYKSDDETVKDDVFKKPDSVESNRHDPEKTPHEVKINQTTSSLNQETSKPEHKGSSEVFDKSHRLSNVSNKEVVRKAIMHPDKEKKGLKELTDFKAEIKNRDQKKTESILSEKNQDSRFDSERFADLKLTKGQVKRTKLGKEKGESASATEFQEREPSRTSAWNKVVPNETSQSSATKKSLVEIQKEEEELSKKAVEGKVLDKRETVAESTNGQERSSPTENKFRSDAFQNKPFPKPEIEHQNDRRGRLDDDSKRRYNKFEKDNQKYDFKSRDEGYRDHPRDNYRKRNEHIPKDSLLQSNEESMTKSSQKDYDIRRESRRDYPRYNDHEGFKKEYDRPKRDRGDREYDKYKKDRGDADYDKYKKDRGDGEKDRYKKDRGDNENDRYKKDRGDGENDRYRKDKVDVENDRYRKDKVDAESDRFKKVRSDLEYTRIKKERGETDYENKYKKDKGDLEHDRIKKDRGDGEFERHKKDRGDGDYSNKYKKDRGDGEYDRFKKDRGDSSYKRDGKVDKYSEKLLPKSASIELQFDLVEVKQEMSTEKPINNSNEGEKFIKPVKKDIEKYESSRRDREFYNRNTDRKKEYNSDYHKHDRRGSRRNDRKDSFFDKDSGKKYSNKFSHEDDLKTPNKDSIISKEVKTESIALDVSEKVLSKDEDFKNVAEAKEQKDSGIVKDMPKKDAPNKEVDIKPDTLTKGDSNKDISVPQSKLSRYNKSRKYDDYYRSTDKSPYNYLDSKDEAYEVVGRGRGRQSRGHEHSSGNKSNEKIRLSLEDVSDEELVSGDEDLKTRKPGKKTHQKTWEQDRPPRFQQKFENEDVFRGRGARGSDRSRTSRGRGRGASNFHARVEEKVIQENVIKNSSEVIGPVDELLPIATNETFAEQRRPQSNRDRGFKGRGRNTYRGNGSGSSSGLRLDKSDSFLVNRQQLGNTHTSNNIANPQTAADKIDSSEQDENILNKKSASNLEDISTTSPTKKNKPAEKKRDIRREFDLSNIASVVCIDDMKNFDSISIKSTEDDGFVKVTSKKHQKELRDKYREEEKRKVLLEQKKEANKALKLARKEKVALKKAIAPIPEVPASVSEQLSISAHIPLPVTSVTPISQPVTSNLHDMMGVWEPAQSLMRTSQSNPLSDQISSAGSVSSNAWQRPLTLTSTSASLPDPRAVGTGKPVSVPGAIKVTIIPTQATPEAASPIVTPPPLAPILSGNGVSMISELDNSNTSLKRDFAKKKSSEGKQQLSQNTHKTQVINDEVQRKVKSNPKKEPKSVSKKYLPERPPRFQVNPRRDGDERIKKYSEPRKEKYSGRRDEKSHRLSDKPKKIEKFLSDIKQPKSVEKPISLNNNEVFLNENVSEEMQTKSLLSEEEKVVGSKKPSIKTQTSVGSYKSSDVFEEPAKEVKLANQFQAPQDNINKSLSKESEKNAKKTAQSLVKSITGDEERSLETRSLPGSPSLAVKIPEPTLCGPSSDPGKVPDPNIKFASSIAQEMNEMNRKLLDAKKAWDETPTAWSDSASKVKTVSVVSSSSAADSVPAHTECLPTVSKFEQLSTVSITEVKSTEEKTSQPFPNKRPEQQNICKVKPQQQIPSEDNRSYISTNLQHGVSNLSSQSNRSRYVLNMDRQVQPNIYESVYSDQLRTQGNQLAFSRLGHIHAMDQVVPPMSQRPEMVLSSLPVGNPNSHLFGIDPSIQNNQNALLAWQMVSTTNVQPTKTLHYPAQHHQGSLFTSPVSISSSQLVMPYGGAFSPQRSTAGIQRQALMQHNQTAVMSPQEVNLNIQEPYVGRVVGVLQPQPTQSQTRRDHQQFQGMLPSQPLLSTNSMTLLLDPSNAQTHLSQQQRSDLMKHVHAKPFEPTSQTPPLMQSPPVLSHHHSATPIQQQVISTVFSQPVTHQQTQQKYSQPLIHRQTNHQQTNPLVAPVRPRAVHGQSTGTSPPLRTLSNHQEQIMNNHHFDQNFVFSNALGLGHPPRGSVIQPVHVTPHPINSQYVGNFLQQPYQQNVQSRPTFNLSQNKPPGPIQRPLQISPSNYSSINHSSNDEEFKRIQRQKMLDDTKKYFQSDGSAPNGNNGMAKEDVSSTSTTLSKHDKLIIPDKPKDKRFDFKKSVRNGEQTRGTRNQRQKSTPSTSSLPPGKAYDASQNKRSTSKV